MFGVRALLIPPLAALHLSSGKGLVREEGGTREGTEGDGLLGLCPFHSWHEPTSHEKLTSVGQTRAGETTRDGGGGSGKCWREARAGGGNSLT